MIRWLTSWWHARQRDIDLKILWPTCKREADDLDHAKMAFAYHAFHDHAWLCLGHDEIKRRIDNLQ